MSISTHRVAFLIEGVVVVLSVVEGLAVSSIVKGLVVRFVAAWGRVCVFVGVFNGSHRH